MGLGFERGLYIILYIWRDLCIVQVGAPKYYEITNFILAPATGTSDKRGNWLGGQPRQG